MSVITQDGTARELSADEQEERAKVCFALESQIKQNIVAGRAALWLLAKNLYEFDEASGWTALGMNQGEWLAQPEISLSRDQYFRLVTIHRELVVVRDVAEGELLQLDHTKVTIVMPTIRKNKAPLDEVLEDVKVLPASALRDKYIGTTDPDKNGNGPEPVIDGKATDLSVEDSNGDGDPEEAKRVAALHQATLAVDSWIELGGDRRKAARNWAKLVELHPVLDAVRQITSCIEGGEDAPKRDEEIGGVWRDLVENLNLNLGG